MEADILESKEDLYHVQKLTYGWWRLIWLCFVVSIGITACSIIMDVALVIKTAERHLIYLVATELMSLASYCFYFVVHLFCI